MRFSTAVIASLALLLSLPPVAFGQSLSQEWQGYDDALARGERHANLWQASWVGIYGASLGLNAYQASEASDRDDRYDARVGVVKSALALGGMFLNRQPHPEAYRNFRALEEGDDLDRARALIRETAADEQQRRSFEARLGSLAVNTASGLLIGVGDGRGRDGAINFATGMLISELQLQTQPRQAGHALNRFQPAQASLGELRFDYEYALLASPEQLGVAIRY
ncbi:hypothetical protein SAMN05192555_1277 [Franzmannia pantelleriensis]|uniref:Uncharacterized protein n=1 Tax=Franzmannia pantelleriensis TaxID=48727 RepID=A0A1G9X4B0_9GAMM|nr:hypothetical protein [Halomonas pantelleriensis]SDM91599.1 hypothetical protein SAMN05192555_1277 [Halomonas pantelleriensis]